MTSSHQNITSSAVTGAPSDHFRPSRSLKVYSLPSWLRWIVSAKLGMTCCHSMSQRSRFSQPTVRLSQTLSAGPRIVVRQVPPYLPICSTGLTTSGVFGSR